MSNLENNTPAQLLDQPTRERVDVLWSQYRLARITAEFCAGELSALGYSPTDQDIWFQQANEDSEHD